MSGKTGKKRTKANKAKAVFLLFVFVALVSVVIYAGCKSGGDPSGITPKIERKGTQGIILSFLDKMPPSEVQSAETFSLGLMLVNNGFTDADNVKLLVHNYDPSYHTVSFARSATEEENEGVIGQDNTAIIQKILGKSIERSEGETKYVYFQTNRVMADNKPVEPIEPVFNQKFVVTYCYPYKTEFVETICLDPFYNKPNKLFQSCQVQKKITTSNGQGAPVSISKIEESIIYPQGTPKAEFRVYIRNAGKGKIMKLSSYDTECSKDKVTKEDDFDTITMSATIGKDAVDCYAPGHEQSIAPQGKQEIMISLKQISEETQEQEAYVICKKNLQSLKEAYATTLNIKLEYGYVDKEEATVSMKKY